MIQANELRVGNLVFSNLTGKEFQVTAADILNISQDPLVVEPVTLTEELLLKFGFILDNERIKSTNYVEFSIGNFILASHNRIDYWILLGTGIKIKPVHQLQNAYHIFKGKELTK
jgi:hypothetical protein